MRFPRTLATPFVLATRNETPTTDQKHLPALTHRQTKHPTSPYNKKTPMLHTNSNAFKICGEFGTDLLTGSRRALECRAWHCVAFTHRSDKPAGRMTLTEWLRSPTPHRPHGLSSTDVDVPFLCRGNRHPALAGN